MILKTLKKAESTWRETAKLATPLDSEKPVILGTKPRQGDFEAYTDDKSIFINVDEGKFKKNFEDIIIPAYKDSAHMLYSLPKIPSKELLENLVFDNFLFVHFHEQLHPWLCPNSKEDERKITKALYDGIKKAEPKLAKTDILLKTNNCKNLIWDIVLNVSFLSKTAGYNNDDLEKKLSFVFDKNKREIGKIPMTKYPNGILPILYITSANNRTTDIPISLVGGMYSTLSFNNSITREKALEFFLDDLDSKKISNTETINIIQNMYNGFVDNLDKGEAKKRRIDVKEFTDNISMIGDWKNSKYQDNQKYFISTLTRIFDSPNLRYDSLSGFIQKISKYISLNQKQGSPDSNSSGSSQGSENGEQGGGGSGDGEDSGTGEDKSQSEIDAESMSDTLEDLLGELDKKEADELLEEAHKKGTEDKWGYGHAGAARANPLIKKINIMSADEYYKRNSEVLDVRNPSQEDVSFSLGTNKKWKLVRSDTLTPTDVSRLNHAKIINFQKSTGLPVLVEAGGGFYKLNQYILEETPQKSYNSQLTGIEIPDNWVLFQDTSSSMTNGAYLGSGDKFDVLNRVKYGLMKGLYKVGKEMHKETKFGIVDFSDKTRYRGLDSLIRIYEARNHPVKEISLTPQCGGTQINSDVFGLIKKDLKPGKSIYTLITDGDIYGDTTSLYKKIVDFSKEPNHSFVYIDIGRQSGFGSSIDNLSKKEKNVLYYTVSNVKEIKDKLGSVLINYT